MTDGYSGADLHNLCAEAALGPIREIKDVRRIETIRKININDFLSGIKKVKPTVNIKELRNYEEWNNSFGSFNMHEMI